MASQRKSGSLAKSQSARVEEDEGKIAEAMKSLGLDDSQPEELGWSIDALSKYFNSWANEDMQIDVAETFHDGVLVVKTPKGKTHFSCPRTLPVPTLWPDRPLLLRESLIHTRWNATSEERPIPTNGTPFPFETELFKGHILMRVKGSESSKLYFEGRNRLSSCVISGKFKKEIPFKDVQTGQEFCKPVRQPSTFVSTAAIKFFRLLAPLLNVHVGKQSYLLSPLAQTAQIIHISDKPLEFKPDMELEENFGKLELGQDLDQVKRKKHFATRKNLTNHVFKTDKYYSFDFYNDKLDMQRFKLLALGQEFDVQKYLRGQPLRILSRVFQPGEPKELYLWNFEIWHESAIGYLKEG